MKPKEKAEEIWAKLFQKQIELTGNGDGNLCAEISLILVDELIKEQTMWQNGELNPVLYWQEVKQEIEKL